MTNSLPRTGVEKVLGMFGCTTVLEIYPPPNSVPPQYSITGFPPASWLRYRISDGFEHSPVELNKRIADPIKPFHAACLPPAAYHTWNDAQYIDSRILHKPTECLAPRRPIK